MAMLPQPQQALVPAPPALLQELPARRLPPALPHPLPALLHPQAKLLPLPARTRNSFPNTAVFFRPV
jgi:hypothetical protein